VTKYSSYLPRAESAPTSTVHTSLFLTAEELMARISVHVQLKCLASLGHRLVLHGINGIQHSASAHCKLHFPLIATGFINHHEHRICFQPELMHIYCMYVYTPSHMNANLGLSI